MVGEGVCKLFRIDAGNALKLMPSVLGKRESQAYTCHAWLMDYEAEESLVGDESFTEAITTAFT